MTIPTLDVKVWAEQFTIIIHLYSAVVKFIPHFISYEYIEIGVILI